LIGVLTFIINSSGGDSALPDYPGLEKLPRLPEQQTRMPGYDWLVTPTELQTGIYRNSHSKEIVMNNGLISRT